MWLKRVRPVTPNWSIVRYASLRPSPWSRNGRRPLRRLDSNKPSRRPDNSSSHNNAEGSKSATDPQESRLDSLSRTLHDTAPQNNSLLAPVHIPEDPNAVLKERHPAAGILANSGLVVQRQLEMMNLLIGFEQANRYVILDAHGNHVGYMAEQEQGFGKMLARQWFHTHRSFVTHVFDRHQNEVLRFHRPFSWINSRIRVYDPLEVADAAQSSFTGLQTVSGGVVTTSTAGEVAKISSLDLSEMRIIGEAHQRWALLRRKYELFLFHGNSNPETNMGTQIPALADTGLSKSQQLQVVRESGGQFSQFAYVDEPFLSWDFSLRTADSRLIGSVNRNFAGFAREIFTDTGIYALRMDSASLAEEQQQRHIISQTHRTPVKSTGMTLDQRAVMLATAVSIDFDYFSRHSGGHGIIPIPVFGGSGVGTAGAEGAAAGGTVAGGASEAAAAGMAGAGTMAGYEAMRRGMSEPQGPQEQQSGIPEQQQLPGEGEEVWGETEDWWGARRGQDNIPPAGGEGGSGDGEEEWSDWF
ncbi:hypothetical protein VTO42DRAFT_6424 [Malbranchea cinnamomea]